MKPITEILVVSLAVVGIWLVLSVLLWKVVQTLRRRRGDQLTTPTSLVGALGRVIVSVSQGGVGTIAVASFGRRITLPARSWDETCLERRTEIVIVAMQNHVALVAPSALSQR